MKTIRILLACIAAALAVSSCGIGVEPPAVEPPVPPKIVQVTDPAPAVRVVQRQAERLEAKVEDTSKRVEEVERTVDKAVEDAIRAGDAEREAQLKTMQAQVRELRVVAQTATDTVKAMREDMAETKAALEKIAVERDEAVRQADAARSQVISEHKTHAADMATMTEKKAAETERADAWRRRAVRTWGILASVVLLGVGLKIYRII